MCGRLSVCIPIFALLLISACGSEETVVQPDARPHVDARHIDAVVVPDAEETPDAPPAQPDGPPAQPDAAVPTPDAHVNPPDAHVNPPDAAVPMPDGPVTGACVDPNEPNDSTGAATALPASDMTGLGVCTASDHDLFVASPSAANKLYVFSVDSVLADGDLDLLLRNSSGQAIAFSDIQPEMYNSEATVGPTNLQSFSLVGGPGPQPVYLDVYGWDGATNDYTLRSRQVTWKDGIDCVAAGFTRGDCRAQNGAQNMDASQFLPFPVGHDKDPFLPGATFTLSGLEAGMDFTPQMRQIGRRETIMIIRNAVHEVRAAFPGTGAYGLGDLGMPDGGTPEGHPNNTHYQGANMDIAYFIDPAKARAWGNMTYRQICCDAADILDWSCVDTDTSSASYGTCKAGGENTHIVDLDRTAMLIAKIAASGRLRVIGVEAKVAPQIKTHMDMLVQQGKLTAAEATAGKNLMVTASDDPSWVWHFNHMHASFCTRDCTSGRGVMEGPMDPDLHLPLAEQARRVREYVRPSGPRLE